MLFFFLPCWISQFILCMYFKIIMIKFKYFKWFESLNKYDLMIMIDSV